MLLLIILSRLSTSTPKPAEAINKKIEGDTKLTFPEALLWASNQESLHGATVGWVVVGNKVRGIFAAADTVRPEALNALKMIKDLSIELFMLTGDNGGSANRVANSIKSEDGKSIFTAVHSSLKPEEKVYWVKKLEEQNRNSGAWACCSSKKKNNTVVAMIGDGVNDSPSLAAANVSIAMGAAGSPVAIETADVALMDSDLRKVGWFFKLSRDTRKKIFQNITFAIVVKLITIILSILGYVGLGVAIGIDVGSMLLVTLNGVDLLRTYPKSSTKLSSIKDTTISYQQNEIKTENVAIV